jgi:hypothetical protein
VRAAIHDQRGDQRGGGIAGKFAKGRQRRNAVGYPRGEMRDEAPHQQQRTLCRGQRQPAGEQQSAGRPRLGHWQRGRSEFRRKEIGDGEHCDRPHAPDVMRAVGHI